ncbi:MAG: cytochrome b/b6 domain-containing protein [Burkholderiales bacterium]|nr:cytochrome b/b6 domain-containing protein [Burkholderiales bacterium]
MNTTSGSRADAAPAAATPVPVLVWDAPVRLFHWAMVLCFAGAFLTAESERWRLVHETLGTTMLGLVGFRVVWGCIGTRYARFTEFVRGPGRVLDYLRAMRRGRPPRYLGHNPAGSVAIVALLLLTCALGATGLLQGAGIEPPGFEEAHEFVANLLLAVVGAHVAGVLLGSWQHRENLLGAMITGRKPGAPGDAIGQPWRPVALLLAAAILAFWLWRWGSA